MCTMCVRGSEPLHPKRYAGILLVYVAYIALCDAHTSGPCVWPTDDWDGDPGTSKRNRATSKLYGQPT